MTYTHTQTHTLHTHTHTCKCRQTWTLKIIWNYNAKTRTRVCEIALANRGHPAGCVTYHSLTVDLPLQRYFFFFLHVYPHAFAFVCTISLIEGNRGQSTVAVLSSIWFWCVGSCPRFPVKTNAHKHKHTHTNACTHKFITHKYKHTLRPPKWNIWFVIVKWRRRKKITWNINLPMRWISSMKSSMLNCDCFLMVLVPFGSVAGSPTDREVGSLASGGDASSTFCMAPGSATGRAAVLLASGGDDFLDLLYGSEVPRQVGRRSR